MVEHKAKVSVLMCVYNSERFLREAIESVLQQTFTDFELLIVNDGSTDNSVKIIESYTHPRIRVLHQIINQGITKCRRLGLEKAKGEYIAILDSDDLALPSRLKKQVSFLDHNPDMNLIGSWTEIIDEAGKKIGIRRGSTDPLIIKWMLGFNNCIANSSILFRREAALHIRAYHFDSPACEDYDTLIKFNNLGGIGCIPEVLVYIREHKNRLSRIEPLTNKLLVLKSVQNYLSTFLDKSVNLEVCKCIVFSYYIKIYDQKILLMSAKILLEYLEKFLKRHPLSSSQIKEMRCYLAKYLMDLARLYANVFPSTSKKIIRISLKQNLKGFFSILFLKSVLKSYLGFRGRGA